MAQRGPWRVSQQLRADHGSGVRCSRPGQHQRVLPLSAGALLPLSQNSARDPQTVMKLAVEPDAVEEAAIYLAGPRVADRTASPSHLSAVLTRATSCKSRV